MSRLFLLVLASILFTSAAYAEVGFRLFTVNNTEGRSLEVAVWYPSAEKGVVEQVGENAAFVGTPVVKNALPVSGRHPLLLLSHGYGGNWGNTGWLAHAMAARGYIVAAPNHPGTTTRNRDAVQASKLWLRPQDLIVVMNNLIASPSIAGDIDQQRIAAAGHSLGGWTVMALAGARFSTSRLSKDCENHTLLGACKVASPLGITKPGAADRLAADLSNARIKAVVSLDLGLARGFTPQSLAGIRLPVLVMAAQANSDDVPAQLESGYLMRFLPADRAQFVSVAGATHFSFMQLCKPGAQALIEEDAPGEGVVCQDGARASREQIHHQLINQISHFLDRALDYSPRNDDTPLGSSPSGA